MKAKHFRRLRQDGKYYIVQVSNNLFGEFMAKWANSIVVLARTPLEAVKRARKRGYGKTHGCHEFPIGETFADFKVKEVGKTDVSFNIIYY